MLALKELLQECAIGEPADDAYASASDNASYNASSTPVESGLESVPSVSQHRALIFCQVSNSSCFDAR